MSPERVYYFWGGPVDGEPVEPSCISNPENPPDRIYVPGLDTKMRVVRYVYERDEGRYRYGHMVLGL